MASMSFIAGIMIGSVISMLVFASPISCASNLTAVATLTNSTSTVKGILTMVQQSGTGNISAALDLSGVDPGTTISIVGYVDGAEIGDIDVTVLASGVVLLDPLGSLEIVSIMLMILKHEKVLEHEKVQLLIPIHSWVIWIPSLVRLLESF
ncbi:hypothetical protein Dimus_012139 [Dionaea muscipula]